MTNEDKAKELAEDNEQSYIMYDGETETTSYKECYQTALEMAEWKDKQYQELLENSIKWFNDIAELCSKLTSGNVSHLGATIRGKAIRAAEFIEKHKND